MGFEEGREMGVSFAGTKLHEIFVERNKYVEDEYNNYIRVNSQNGKRHRCMEWLFLIRVNLAYFLLNRRSENFIGIDNYSAQMKGRLPYLDGAESEIYKRKKEIHLVNDLMQYDVISFDIFDTLVLRPFAKPTDLFMVVGNKLKILNFMRIRMEAEKVARNESMVLNGNYEVTIYEIYEKLSRKTGIDIQHGIETEFETEMEFCFANPYMKRVYELLKDQGKKIILTSDMYIPNEMMEKLLKSCGYEGYYKLYVSCDYGCNKSSGGLYKTIRHEMGDDAKIVHVGDNYAVDINSAKSNGLSACFYKNCHEIGNQYRADNMSELVGSFYAGIVNTHLHNGIKQYGPYYEYGYIYGGLYVTGYCNWIHKKAKEENIDKVLFLSRDGYIYQKIFNMMFDDVLNEYVYWSRIANLKYTIENQRGDYLLRIVQHNALAVNPRTYGDILTSVSLQKLIPDLKKCGMDKDMLFTIEKCKVFEDFLINNWKKIEDIYNEETIELKKLMEKILSGCKNIAVVDVGWVGSGPLGIKYLIEEKWGFDCRVKCWLAASRDVYNEKNLNELMNCEIEAYMFSQIKNRQLYDFHANTNKGLNNICLELFTQARHPSFRGINKEGKMEFDISEAENYERIKEIHSGIMDFAEDYYTRTKQSCYLRNISGSDAYSAFCMIIKDLKFVKNYFRDFSFARDISGNISKQKIEKISEIINSVHA